MEIFSFRELSGGERRWRNFINLICEQNAETKVGSIRFSTVTKKRIEYFPNMAEVTEQSVNEVVTRRTILRLQHDNTWRRGRFFICYVYDTVSFLHKTAGYSNRLLTLIS